MRRDIYIVGGIAAAFVAGVVAVAASPRLVPLPAPYQAIEAPSTTVRTKDGAALSVPNFTEGAPRTELPEGTYIDVSPVSGEVGVPLPYSVQYEPETSTFTVLLNDPALGSTRIAVGSFLNDILLLSNADLCRLKITVLVSPDISERYAKYDDLGLSFCPGAIPLPN